MIKRWNEMDTFAKVAVAMLLLWVVGVCTIVLGYEATGCVLIWLAVAIDVAAVIVVWIKKRNIKNENNLQN